MQIAVAGAGYVGLTTAACLCELGHSVTLVEIDAARVETLQSGGCPIYEPGLSELLQAHLGSRLHVTADLQEALQGARALFACVGTPPRQTGAPDLGALRRLLGDLRLRLSGADDAPVIVLKSTVPPGTNRWAQRLLGGAPPVVSNPEFLREGTAIHDFFHPDRVVVGGEDPESVSLVAGLYAGFEAPLLTTGWEQAELIKYATNAFLALKVSFANEIAAVCDAVGADVRETLQGVGLDHRIGPRFLSPGPGYGGSCLPKDLRALLWKARRCGVRLDVIPAAEHANSRQRFRLLQKLTRGLGDLWGKTIAVWGLAFKAGTDDVRSAASLELIPQVLAMGARVHAHDPQGLITFARACPPERWPGLILSGDQWRALRGADALLVLTEWEEYRTAPLTAIATQMKGSVIVDGRNLFEPGEARAAGLIYFGVGRS
jgi:UDPglucose 6-dehydrogenase